MRAIPLLLILLFAVSSSPAAAPLEQLQAISDSDMLIVPASAPKVASIIVFTDIDCPYCLLLHNRYEEYSRRGIEIRYLFYPRSGPSGASFGRAVAVWCSHNRLDALGAALRGASLPDAQCANPIAQHYAMARDLGLKGTPALITADGRVLYGARTPDEVLALSRPAHRGTGTP